MKLIIQRVEGSTFSDFADVTRRLHDGQHRLKFGADELTWAPAADLARRDG